MTESAQGKGHFSRYNCLVLGHTKYNGVRRVYCNPFPVKPCYGSPSHRLDPVIIRPLGLDEGQFGMYGIYSFSQPHHKPTPGPKRLTVHSCQRWKYTLILEMVIIVIIVFVVIIVISVPIELV